MQRHNLKPGLPGAGEAAEPPALLGPRPGLDTMGDPLSQPDCNFRRCLCGLHQPRHQRRLGARFEEAGCC